MWRVGLVGSWDMNEVKHTPVMIYWMLFAVDCEKGEIPYHSRNMILLRNEWVCDCVKMSKCEMYLGVPFSALPSINHTRRRYYVREGRTFQPLTKMFQISAELWNSFSLQDKTNNWSWNSWLHSGQRSQNVTFKRLREWFDDIVASRFFNCSLRSPMATIPSSLRRRDNVSQQKNYMIQFFFLSTALTVRCVRLQFPSSLYHTCDSVRRTYSEKKKLFVIKAEEEKKEGIKF